MAHATTCAPGTAPCYRCGLTLPVESFALDRTKASGRKTICKPCDNARSKKRYAQQARPPRPRVVRQCERCGSDFILRHGRQRFCGTGCWVRAPRPLETVACKNCGDEFERSTNGGRRQVYCGQHCESAAKRNKCAECGIRTATAMRARCCGPCAERRQWEHEMWALVRKWLNRPVSTAKPPRTTTCEHCGATFKTPQPAQRFCSRQCSHRHHGHASNARRRERIKKQHVAPVYRRRIAERDKWRCKLCGKKVRRDAKAPHPLAPSLDHIVPIALGGKHEPSNVQLAHFRCNAIKGVDARDEQLMLIG